MHQTQENLIITCKDYDLKMFYLYIVFRGVFMLLILVFGNPTSR